MERNYVWRNGPAYTPTQYGAYPVWRVRILRAQEASYQALSVRPLATFQEREGLTVIIPRAEADQLHVPYSYVGTLITLNVHSSLNAVGFLAKITAKLAEHGLSLNAFSPVYQDHIFVRLEDADYAMSLLVELSTEAR